MDFNFNYKVVMLNSIKDQVAKYFTRSESSDPEQDIYHLKFFNS